MHLLLSTLKKGVKVHLITFFLLCRVVNLFFTINGSGFLFVYVVSHFEVTSNI